jgi:hypothetical protein
MKNRLNNTVYYCHRNQYPYVIANAPKRGLNTHVATETRKMERQEERVDGLDNRQWTPSIMHGQYSCVYDTQDYDETGGGGGRFRL